MTAVSGNIENILLKVIIQLIGIIAAARISGAAFRRLGSQWSAARLRLA